MLFALWMVMLIISGLGIFYFFTTNMQIIEQSFIYQNFALLVNIVLKDNAQISVQVLFIALVAVSISTIITSLMAFAAYHSNRHVAEIERNRRRRSQATVIRSHDVALPIVERERPPQRVVTLPQTTETETVTDQHRDEAQPATRRSSEILTQNVTPISVVAFSMVSRNVHAEGYSLGDNIDLRNASSLRPIVSIKVALESLVGKKLPVTVDIIDPRGTVVYRQHYTVALKLGVNDIIDPNGKLRIDESTRVGKWNALLCVGTDSLLPLAELSFRISNRSLLDNDIIGADMEITDEALDVIDNISDEELRSIFTV